MIIRFPCSHIHSHWIHHCLALAERGRGYVGNGAMVGAVLVRNGTMIAEGWHAAFGAPHAERALFEQWHGDVCSTDILYVNLEPCCHHGKTPPCTDSILARGVQHVVYGMRDPDVRVSGQGIDTLIKNGVHVFGPVLHQNCERLNRGFITLRTKNRPFITLKSAHTRDGRIASDDGQPLAITTNAQNVWSHTWLRARHDAILVGVGTMVTDDPRMDARLSVHHASLFSAQEEGERVGAPWNPLRVILDPRLRIALTARVVSDDHPERTMIIHAPVVTREQEDVMAVLHKRGILLREVPIHAHTFDWQLLWQALIASDGDYHGITSMLVEGGRRTWNTFRSAEMVDEEVILTN